MTDFERALRELCMKVEDFRAISRRIIYPDSKRRECLKNFAEALCKAARDFVKAVNDENQRTDERKQRQRDGG